MTKTTPWALALASASLVVNVRAGNFADTVISYNAGTGFANGYTNSATVVGAPTASATPFAPAFQNTQILSIGAGGSLTVQFGTPIQNDPSHPFGLDFTIFGNSFFVKSGSTANGSIFSSTSPGSAQVLVSQDGINFYTLNPSVAPTVNYSFPTDGAGDPSVPVNPSLTPADFTGLDLTGIRSLYNGSAGGTSYDISWAEDSQGNPVSLSSIDYVEVEVSSGRAQIDSLSEVPEPTMIKLLGAGILFLAWPLSKVQPKRQK